MEVMPPSPLHAFTNLLLVSTRWCRGAGCSSLHPQVGIVETRMKWISDPRSIEQTVVSCGVQRVCEDASSCGGDLLR